MADMNFDRTLRTFLDFNMSIETSIFKKTVFLDEKVEQQYKLEKLKTSKKNKIHLDAFMVFCYIAIIFYIYINKYKMIFLYLGLGCLGICLLLIAFSYYIKSPRFNEAINHVMIFLMSIFLNFKMIYIACFLITQENDYDSEIIRTLTYDYISKNILYVIALDTKMSVTVPLYLLNLCAMIVTEIKTSSAHNYYLDNLVGLIITLFCLYFKKLIEAEHRDKFAGKYQFENYYNYTRDFIKGLNGNYINISNGSSNFYYAETRMLENDKSIDVQASKGKNIVRNQGMKQIDETNKIIEINSFISINNGELEDISSKSYADALSHFTLYNNGEILSENLNGADPKLIDKLKVLMLEPSTPNFRRVGIYKLNSLSCVKYFEVHFRKFSLKNFNSINDLYIYDITELIESKHKIMEDVIFNQKFLAKMVHEFKTPVNSIIGLIGSIEDSIKTENTEANKLAMKRLETVRGLSNYVIFQTSDIIHFSSMKNLEDVGINLEDINIREIMNFGFNVLNSLLTCNKAKSDAIKPVLEYEHDIDSFQIKADDKRLKQIIINFVSNAVKFTKSGQIKLKCETLPERECVMLSLSDTGVGIGEEEKDKLFNDIKLIKKDSAKNGMGTGLGLSICKSLASSMSMQILTSSKLGQGSVFSLAIPIIPQPLSNRALKKLISVKNNDKLDEQNEVHLQESKQSNKNNICQIEQTYLSELDQRNGVVIQELKVESNDNSMSESKRSSRETVRLGCNGYINQDLNFHTNNLNKLINNQMWSNSSRSEMNLESISKSKKKGKILIVDDNHFINDATKNVVMKALKESGNEMEIILGTDGSDIIHHVIKDQSEGNEIKFILTDENMEYLNGSEAIRIIRNLEKLQKVKFVNIISVTANEESNITNEIIKAGAQLVLNKPLAKSVIARVLKEFNII